MIFLPHISKWGRRSFARVNLASNSAVFDIENILLILLSLLDNAPHLGW